LSEIYAKDVPHPYSLGLVGLYGKRRSPRQIKKKSQIREVRKMAPFIGWRLVELCDKDFVGRE